jgi:hypothetical protein
MCTGGLSVEVAGAMSLDGEGWRMMWLSCTAVCASVFAISSMAMVKVNGQPRVGETRLAEGV